MKKLIYAILPFSIFACTDVSKPAEQVQKTTDSLAVASAVATKPDTITIWADSTGNISFGSNRNLTLEDLEMKLQDSLKSVKKAYGTLPDTIVLRTKGDVLMGTRGAIRDVMSDAKEKIQ